MSRCGVVMAHGRRVGLLQEGAEGVTFTFTYDREYLVTVGAQAVSLTLPLQAEPYHGANIPPFFVGLLAEGGLAAVQCRMLKLDERDLFGRLLATCRDTIGAVTVHPEEAAP